MLSTHETLLAGLVDSNFRFSGHQTFPLRIAWIPKAVAEISKNNDPLTNTDEGITTLGLGKNMVEALRCWIDAFQIATKETSGWTLTTIGKKIFLPIHGQDPYLEDTVTCWLLHWLIYAWECLFNRWPSTEFCPTSVIDAFRKESDKYLKPLSDVTLKQHWEVFLHSYRSPRGGKGEDHLDSALSVLGLIREVGERQNASGKWEPLYQFDTSVKTGIPQQLFTFFLHDWWNRAFSNEQTIPLRELVNGHQSLGRILKMQELEILQRVADLVYNRPEHFQSEDSTNIRQLRRLLKSDGLDELQSAYTTPRFI